MKLVYALLCDHAFLSIDKKVNIIGIFETINSAVFPVTHSKFTLVGSIEPSKDRFKIAVDIVSKSGKSSILRDPQEREVVLPAERKGNFNFIIEIINTVFPESGEYLVEVKIDGKVISSLPLLLAKISESSASLN